MSITTPGSAVAATGTWLGPGAGTVNPPGGGPTGTIPGYLIVGGNNAVLPGGANSAFFGRSMGAGMISKIALSMAVQSGNICVGVYSGGGSGSNPPTTRIATSGSVPCPAAGFQTIPLLGGPVWVDNTSYLAIAADNATCSFTGTSTSGAGDSLAPVSIGYAYFIGGAFPLPPTLPTLATFRGFCYGLWGQP